MSSSARLALQYRFRLVAAGWIFILWLAPLRAEDQFFDSDGVKIHYIVEGQGEPILLIHGFTANINMQWGAILKGLAANYQVIALDNRGHGASGKPHNVSEYGVKMVEDAINLLDYLKIKKAHVAGYSMGGFITMKLLTAHPDRLASAAVCGAGWGREDDEQMVSLRTELADSLDQGNGFGPLINRLTPAGRPKMSEEQLKNMSAMMSSMNDVKALAACIRGMGGLMVTEAQLRANKVPTIALIGSIDPIKQSLDPMVGVMANLEVVTIEGADHINAPVKPEFIAALKAFLARHPIQVQAAAK